MNCTGHSVYRRFYDVYGLSLSVVTDSKSSLRAVDSVLAPFSVASGEAAKTCKVVINRGEVSREAVCPAGMRQFWAGTLLNGSKIIHWTGEGVHQLDVSGLASTFIDIPSQCATITVREGEEWCIDSGLLLLVLSEFLRAAGHYVVHAASLVYSKNGENSGVLIAGEGGKGKTTTALALCGAGMRLLADDLSFVTRDAADPRLRREASGLVVWGLQKSCKVHYNTLKMLKWLQDLPQRPAIGPDEVLVDVSKHLGCSPPTKVEPRVIIFLDDRNMKEHRINPLGKIDAIKLLAGENVRAFDSNAKGAAGETFRTLGSLVGQCDCHLLSAGPDVAGLYEIFTALLR